MLFNAIRLFVLEYYGIDRIISLISSDLNAQTFEFEFLLPGKQMFVNAIDFLDMTDFLSCVYLAELQPFTAMRTLASVIFMFSIFLAAMSSVSQRVLVDAFSTAYRKNTMADNVDAAAAAAVRLTSPVSPLINNRTSEVLTCIFFSLVELPRRYILPPVPLSQLSCSILSSYSFVLDVTHRRDRSHNSISSSSRQLFQTGQAIGFLCWWRTQCTRFTASHSSTCLCWCCVCTC